MNSAHLLSDVGTMKEVTQKPKLRRLGHAVSRIDRIIAKGFDRAFKSALDRAGTAAMSNKVS